MNKPLQPQQHLLTDLSVEKSLLAVFPEIFQVFQSFLLGFYEAFLPVLTSVAAFLFNKLIEINLEILDMVQYILVYL